MSMQMTPPIAARHPAAAVAQPQRAADRRRDRPCPPTDIEQLAVLANHHVDPRPVAGQHPGDVQGDRRAVGQEAAELSYALTRALLEQRGRGDHHQLVRRAEGPRAVLQIGPGEVDHRVGPALLEGRIVVGRRG
ncbi:MAG: hypothetical protein R6X02_15510 [Enhygromyxa sp.]